MKVFNTHAGIRNKDLLKSQNKTGENILDISKYGIIEYILEKNWRNTKSNF